ncbi:MAG: S8 family serine peptidase, partial [Prevotellaceae bacterium]|nr:S8 family serine peptidase [Prevotellaceae bacterium]
MKTIILSTLCLLLLSMPTRAQLPDTLKYRISLTDKLATRHSLSRPHEFLSDKALERRRRQGIAIDSADLPVCRDYIDAIQRTGVRIVVAGKWDNFVTVACNDSTLIDAVARLPFVRHTERVWRTPGVDKPYMSTRRDSLVNRPDTFPAGIYGAAFGQIAQSNGQQLHEAGFRGEGMTIAVIDAGFHNADRITALHHARVLGTRDFVNPASDIFAESGHGTGVLSCIAANAPYVLTGTAPEASFWLLRSEDEYSENLVEQDYWAAAVEFADSVGVDVLNASLGYYTFDDRAKNYDFCHLDGRFALISRQASRLADKGMVLVCSAGNTGIGSWKKITPPADADHVLTVGATDDEGVLAMFSAVGNTTDNRVKPDIMAIG